MGFNLGFKGLNSEPMLGNDSFMSILAWIQWLGVRQPASVRFWHGPYWKCSLSFSQTFIGCPLCVLLILALQRHNRF